MPAIGLQPVEAVESTEEKTAPTTAANAAPAEPIATPATKPVPATPAVVPTVRRRRLRKVLMVIAFFMVVNEVMIGSAASRAAAKAVTRELADIDDLWNEYDQLARRSYLGFGIAGLQEALKSRTQELADRVIHNYRSPEPTVREAQWESARNALRHALTAEPRNRRIKAALRYCDGHLHRINGEARKSRRQLPGARQELTDAVTAFREAAELRPDWPDPFLGLMRTFIYGLEDIDRGADALKQAQHLGFSAGARETMQLADGYRTRGETLIRTARTLQGLPQESEYLQRAAEIAARSADVVRPRARLGWRRPESQAHAAGAGTCRRASRRHGGSRSWKSREDHHGSRSGGPSRAGHPMAITYTRAAERDQQVVHRALQTPGVGDLVLLAISVVTIGLLSAAYLGRTTLAQAAPGASPVVNLNTVADAAALEPALAAAFDNPADRRLAARELFGFLAQADGGRRVLPNVGAIARAEVPAAAIEKDPGLIVYRDRLRDARQREPASPQAARMVPLVTSAELSAVKPSLVVRSTSVVRRSLFVWGLLYLAAMHAVSLVWRLRGIRGDHALLAAAHFLTAAGFAVMVGRADPLRDMMLFVRYAKTCMHRRGRHGARVDRELPHGRVPRFQLPPAGGRARALAGADPVRQRARPQRREGQSRAGAADRSDPAAARAVSGRLFRAALGAAQGSAQRDGPRPHGCRRGCNVPRVEYVLPVLAGVAAGARLFFLQKDLGPALFLSLRVPGDVRRRARRAGDGRSPGSRCSWPASTSGYRLQHLANARRARPHVAVAMGQRGARRRPDGAGAVGAWRRAAHSGTGLGLGRHALLPAGHTDLVLAAVGEELGVVGIVALAAAMRSWSWRGFRIARRRPATTASSWHAR